MKRLLAAISVSACMIMSTCRAGEPTGKSLDIYFLDMVGGGSTLIVTPLGESVLIDTGSLEPRHRDADRILQACRFARLSQIDYLVTTHFDVDHYGAILEVSERIPVKCFIDKGALPPEKQRDRQSFNRLYPLYEKATGGKVSALRPGDDIPLKNDLAGSLPAIKLHCVAAEKQIEGFEGDIDAPVEGFVMKKPDETDNARSIALLLSYGKFKFFAGGDITWNVEHHLAHPINRVGKLDLYQITHHGLDMSNNPLLLKALDPTVCVAMNGPRKGIQPGTFAALKALPGLRAMYQIHYNTLYGDKGNTAAEFIANGKDPNGGQLIKASVHPDKGTFSVSIGVDGATRKFSIQQ